MSMVHPFLCVLGVAFLLAGCASVPGGSSDDQFDKMITAQAAFYYGGPGQMVPDAYLEPGTRVRILAGGGDYLRVQTVNGQEGFVARGTVGDVREPQF